MRREHYEVYEQEFEDIKKTASSAGLGARKTGTRN
jgi:hypothetical protein